MKNVEATADKERGGQWEVMTQRELDLIKNVEATTDKERGIPTLSAGKGLYNKPIRFGTPIQKFMLPSKHVFRFL